MALPSIQVWESAIKTVFSERYWGVCVPIFVLSCWWRETGHSYGSLPCRAAKQYAENEMVSRRMQTAGAAKRRKRCGLHDGEKAARSGRHKNGKRPYASELQRIERSVKTCDMMGSFFAGWWINRKMGGLAQPRFADIPVCRGRRESGRHVSGENELAASLARANAGNVLRFFRRCGGRPSATTRSEERRVGKECRSRWSPYH